ncbi:MAG: MobF family relaxase [Planctomycetota bacterium]
MSAGQERYYLDLAREDYYAEGGEAPGRWWGRAAAHLSLSGLVRPEELAATMRGRAPASGSPLVQLQSYSGGRSRAAGWDLTFSAPKSVSVLWSQAGAHVRNTIEAAQREAVHDALAYLEEHSVFSRRGKGGTRIEAAQLVVATFLHGTSRAQDPNLHVHALVQNVVHRSDGTWGTLHSPELYRHKMVAGAIFRNGLSARLQQQLGVRTRVTKCRSFELLDVPQGVLDGFSTRRGEIEDRMREFGGASAKIGDYATLETRQPKEVRPRTELFSTWRERGQELGFGPRAARELLAAGLRRLPRRPRDPQRLLRRLIRRACVDLLQYQSHFTARKLMERVAVLAQAYPVDVAAVTAAVDEHLKFSSDIVPLRQDGLHARYTTRGMLDIENRMLVRADGLATDRSQERGVKQWDRNRSALGLADTERRAFDQLVDPGSALRTFDCRTDKGRSAVLAAAVDAWRRSGRHVVVTGVHPSGARSAELSHQLENSPTVFGTVCANTVFQRACDLYWHLTRGTDSGSRVPLKHGSILVVDHAERVDTQTMHDLLELAGRRGCRLILAGDRKGAVTRRAGSPFRLLHDRFCGISLEPGQAHDGAAAALCDELDVGDGAAAVRSLHGAGMLYLAETREEATEKMISDWATTEKRRRVDTALVGATRAAIGELNDAAQAERLRRGELSTRSHLRSRPSLGQVLGISRRSKPKVFHAGVRGSYGDRVRVLRGKRSLGVRAGDRGVVERVNPILGTVTIRLDRTGPLGPGVLSLIKRPIRATLTPIEAGQLLELDYAVSTSHMEGRTFDRLFAIADPMLQAHEVTRESLLRASGQAQFYLDEMSAGDAMVSLASSLSRQDRNELATELLPDEREVELEPEL